jgi:hypothetical protein
MFSGGITKRRAVISLLVALWVAGVVFSAALLGDYEFTPGEQGETVKRWPSGISVAFTAKKFNLVVAAHPHCPCSRASLGELSEALATASGPVEVHIVYYQPPGATAEWNQTELVERSGRIPGAHIWFDSRGDIAQTLGARTSFDVFLFNPQQELVFRGGITRGRGVQGENMGRAALEAALAGKDGAKTHPVYGCPLQKNTKNSLRKA